MFHQQLYVNSGAVWLTSPHNIRHIIHNNVTLYLYRMKDSAKLSVNNPQRCLLWKAASCLISNGWMRSVMPGPENYLNLIFLHKEIWGWRVLETYLSLQRQTWNNSANNGILIQKQQNLMVQHKSSLACSRKS